MAVAIPDRLTRLLGQNAVTGLDFVYVHPDQVTLDVHFLRPPGSLAHPLVGDLAKEAVRISSAPGAEPVPDVPVGTMSWPTVDGEDVLRIVTLARGGFSLYALHVADPRIDPYTNGLRFSFKANCDSSLDCAPPAHECPPDAEPEYVIDYSARDFWGFRRALLDYASATYPRWTDRLEADAGVMLLEAMSALGDELSYQRDRIARESHLETATQRRSLRRHARLVDHELDDGAGATTWLRCTAVGGQSGTVAAGAVVSTVAESEPAVAFQVGRGLRDLGVTYAVDADLDGLAPHRWDERDTCLPAGATELAVDGSHAARLPEGKWVMLETDPADRGVPVRAWPVRLAAAAVNDDDPVLVAPITRLRWDASHATPFELELDSLRVHGNLAPGAAGWTVTRRFTIGEPVGRSPLDDVAARPATVERAGPGGAPVHLFSLPGSDADGLVWRADGIPEVRLWELEWTAAGWSRVAEWAFEPSLLRAQRSSRRFTLDDGQWRRVVGFRRPSGDLVHRDYAAGGGATIRFGDGEFGISPARGSVFEVVFRLGNGSRANVPAHTLTRHSLPATLIRAVTNPVAAADGRDPESAEDVRRLAPEAYRALTFRAVRPEDYAEAAERLSWVERAGASFRWTGSWLSAFVTPDPRGSVTLDDARRADLVRWLETFRQAGREAIVRDPVYADVDLRIVVCAEPHAYRGDVERRVLEALRAFFDPDNFTFGTALYRSDLEAAIQRVSGVRAVDRTEIRRRGWHDWYVFSGLRYAIGVHEVLRLAHDPLHPERGTLKLIMKGGA
jgi:hypothetical protein